MLYNTTSFIDVDYTCSNQNQSLTCCSRTGTSDITNFNVQTYAQQLITLGYFDVKDTVEMVTIAIDVFQGTG
jgi:hypothetical protein